jgi:DNA repair photolyase
MAAMRILHVNITITSLNEELRMKLEPRTATYKQRLKVVEQLSKRGIPVNVMMAPIIPSLNDHEIPDVIKAAADAGALSAAYTIVRLNGSIGEIFEDWIRKAYPERADKVLKQITECHGGTLNESRWGIRMRGEGILPETISRMFKIHRNKYMGDREWPEYDYSLFRRPERGQLKLF